MSKKAAAVTAKPSPPPKVCKETMVAPSVKTKVVSAAAGSGSAIPLIVKQVIYTPKARSVQYYKDHCPHCNDKEVEDVEDESMNKQCTKCKLRWHPCVTSKQVIATDTPKVAVECPFCPEDTADEFSKYCDP